VSSLIPLLILFLGGCSVAAADHERLGDRAYRDGRFADAVAEYRAAAKSHGTARVWAKLGSAALHQRDAGTAVSAYTALAAADPDRAAEAAVGLERAAHLAEQGGSAELGNLAAAVRALRAVAPGRPLGHFALAEVAGLPAPEALGALPAALASGGEGRSVDSLLVAFGAAQRRTTACEGATRTFQTVLRRSREPGLRAAAASGLAGCALRLGLDALAADHAADAERWFEAAIGAAAATPAGWRAAIGLGDARLGEGDVLGAALAYQGVLSATGVPDSLTRLAAGKLNELGAPPPEAPKDEGIRE
jgi:hypothetical protein